jgi:transposase-like protein
MKSLSQTLENRLHAFARTKVRSAAQPGVVWNILESEMSVVLTDIVQKRLKEEQEALLNRVPYERGGSVHRNGFKATSLKGLFARLRVKRPVLRRRTPPSPLLGTLRRAGRHVVELLASRFWLRGASTRAVAQELNQAFGTRLAPSDVSRFTNTLLPDIEAWMKRPIPSGIAYLFVDALYLPVRKPHFTAEQALLVAVGLTSKGQRHVLGFLLGDRESTESWSALFKDLLARGLNRQSLALVISDDHKAIRSSVDQTMGVPHQLCVVHKMRNVLARVSTRHRKDVYRDFVAIYWAASRQEAFQALGRFQATWSSIYPKATQMATAEAERFLVFQDQPQALWTTLRSTNLIERFIRELRRRLRPAGAMQSEPELFKLVWSVSVEQEKRWSRQRAFRVSKTKLLVAA